MKILLAKRRALGDTVLLSATIDLIRNAMPNTEITALVPGAFTGALEGHPGLRQLWNYDEGFFPLLWKSRAERFDYFLQLHASPSQSWLPRLSGAAASILHAQNSKTDIIYGKHPDALEWDALLLRRLFGARVPARAQAPKIYLSEAEKKWGRDYWQKYGVEGNKVVYFGLGASRSTKRWLPAHFARLAELLKDRLCLVPAFIVGPGEEEERFAAAVLDHFRSLGLRPRLGQENKGDFIHGVGLSVRELACALSATAAYIGNDSGPKHLAAAVGTHSFTFFGPEDPVEWHPYSREQHPVFFLEGLSCRTEDNGRWCGIRECVVERHRCMRDLDPLDVFARVEEKLSP